MELRSDKVASQGRTRKVRKVKKTTGEYFDYNIVIIVAFILQ